MSLKNKLVILLEEWEENSLDEDFRNSDDWDRGWMHGVHSCIQELKYLIAEDRKEGIKE